MMLKKEFLKYFFIIAFMSGSFLALNAFFNSKEIITYEAPPAIVEISKPEYMDIEKCLMLNGHIEAEAMIPVIPFVNGTIIEYNAKLGEYVEKNDILARIDPEPFEFKMSQAEAAYLGYQQTFERVSSLHKVGAVTQQEYDTVSAQRDAAKAQYELAKLQLSYATVEAPVGGTVLTAPQSVGSVGNTQQPVAVLGSLDALVVRLHVPEIYFDIFSSAENSLEAYVVRQAGGLTVAAEIDTIAPYVEPTAKTFEVKFKLIERLDAFRPGMYIKTKVVYKKHSNVPVIPNTARKFDGSVYLYDKDNKTVKWTKINPEIETDDYFMVSDEFSDSYFVVSGQHSLEDGEVVKIKSEG
ncbi:MAG: efflux RND transporter periplasmic adaptor subunit [Spirochaetales bacterium]|nr:efflux RND transporter periplasmic adaptor subunit [Spirochaetales bacterium]